MQGSRFFPPSIVVGSYGNSVRPRAGNQQWFVELTPMPARRVQSRAQAGDCRVKIKGCVSLFLSLSLSRDSRPRGGRGGLAEVILHFFKLEISSRG